jgi:hypothetical protein
MQEKLTFKLITHDERSVFDWLNIDCGTARVGKARGLISGKTLIICSINIFPEFEGRGYAARTIEMFKESFELRRCRVDVSNFMGRANAVAEYLGDFYGKCSVIEKIAMSLRVVIFLSFKGIEYGDIKY